MNLSNSDFILRIILVFVTLGSATLFDDACIPVNQNMILFAKDASPVPWMAYLMKDGTFICGGSLISQRIVLTAAHCVNSTDNNRLIVRLGEYNTKDNIPASDFHVNYTEKHSTMDIAILTLHNYVSYSENIKPICILSSELYHRLPNVNTFFVTGWGTTSDANMSASSTVLQQMNVKRMHPPQCDDLEGEICGGHPLDEQFVCRGDSGSPLVAYVKYNESTTIAAQYGVVSSSTSLCRDHAYYVDVNELSDWIFKEKISVWNRIFKFFLSLLKKFEK